MALRTQDSVWHCLLPTSRSPSEGANTLLDPASADIVLDQMQVDAGCAFYRHCRPRAEPFLGAKGARYAFNDLWKAAGFELVGTTN